MRVVGWLLFVSFQSIQVSQTEVESSLLTDTLYSCLLSLSGLSLLSLTHSYCSVCVCVCVCVCIYIYMLHSNWEQFSFQPVPSTDLSLIHSHSNNHSLIPQAQANVPLHIAEFITAAMVGLLFDKFMWRLNYWDLIGNSIIWRVHTRMHSCTHAHTHTHTHLFSWDLVNFFSWFSESRYIYLIKENIKIYMCVYNCIYFTKLLNQFDTTLHWFCLQVCCESWEELCGPDKQC